MAYCTQADILEQLDEDILIQLTDDDDLGAVDADMVTRAIADADALIKLGFPTKETYQLCQIIREYAAKLGVRGTEGLRQHFQLHLDEGKSHIVNTIVRRHHKAYFATRALLHPVDLLEHLETEPRDLVGHLIQRSLRLEGTCQRQEADI